MQSISRKLSLAELIKKEPVLMASIVLAVVSSFFVKPSAEYLGYIDFRVLGILMGLMIVMAGFQESGFFAYVGNVSIARTHSVKMLCYVLVFLCFFFSMLITNDVALITFVPFAILVMTMCGREDLLMPIIICQTIAANLGSMVTPLGNPQNLYLYNLTEMSVAKFLQVMLPYSLVSAVLLVVCVQIICRNEGRTSALRDKIYQESIGEAPITFENMIYTVLFVLCLLVVFRVVQYYIVLGIVIGATLAVNPPILKKIDYSLLLTFVFLFIFTGNMGNLPAVNQLLSGGVIGREFLFGVVLSQVISNVPATLLLADFSHNYNNLLIGVNVGGLGTLIASMASLISYKQFVGYNNAAKGRYIVQFTGVNLVFLLVLIAVHWVL